MNPLTRSEVESWPALGPMNLDKQRVLDLFDRIAEFERLQQVWLMSPEAAQRLQGYRDLAEKCAGFEAELAEARALNAQLAAQVDEARRQRDECAARVAELEASAARLSRYRDDRESYWLERQAKWIAEHDQYAKSCEWHAGRAATAEARVAELETEAADWKYLATARRESLAEVEETCDELVARLATQTPAPATNDDARDILHAMASTPLEAAVTAHTEHVAVSVGAFDDRLRFFGSVDEAVEFSELEAELAELRALNAQLAAQVDEARRQREDASARLRELREVAEWNVADAQHLRQSAILLTIERDEARRQRDECAAALQKTTRACECSPESGCTDAQARAVMHAMASEVADSVVDAVSRAANAAVTANTAHVAVTVERAADDLCLPFPLVIRLPDRHELAVTTDEAVALIAALLADGAVHSAWLHGRGGR